MPENPREPPATPAAPPDEATARKEALIKALVNKIKQTAQDVHDTGTGTLTLNQQELQDVLQTLVFSDPDALKTAEKAGLVIPPLPAILNLIIQGGTPSVEFLQTENGVNQVRFIAENTKFKLGLGQVEPKEFKVDKFGIRLENYSESGRRVEGQVGLAGLTVTPDYPVSDIPCDIPALAGIFGALGPGGNSVDGLLRWALEKNVLMTTLFNKTTGIIAANGPEHATTTVKGLKADIGKDSFTMTFLRDTFTPLPRKGYGPFDVLDVITQMQPYSHIKK